MLFDKFKNTTPAPWRRSRLPLYEDIERMQRSVRRQKLLAGFKAALTSFAFALMLIFSTHCLIQYSRSYDRCRQLLAEVNANLGTMHRELDSLKTLYYERVCND